MRDSASRVITAMCLFAAAILIGACGSDHEQAEPTVPPGSSPDFALVSGTVSEIDSEQNVSFSLTFNQAPDFFMVDQFGRVANDFQIVIIPVPDAPDLCADRNRPFASLVRGGEIYVAGDLPIRDDGPPNEQDPASGGWGPVRARVPFGLDEKTVSFSVPASVLNVASTFAFCVQTDVYGGATVQYSGISGRPGLTPWPEGNS